MARSLYVQRQENWLLIFLALHEVDLAGVLMLGQVAGVYTWMTLNILHATQIPDDSYAVPYLFLVLCLSSDELCDYLLYLPLDVCVLSLLEFMLRACSLVCPKHPQKYPVQSNWSKYIY